MGVCHVSGARRGSRAWFMVVAAGGVLAAFAAPALANHHHREMMEERHRMVEAEQARAEERRRDQQDDERRREEKRRDEERRRVGETRQRETDASRKDHDLRQQEMEAKLRTSELRQLEILESRRSEEIGLVLPAALILPRIVGDAGGLLTLLGGSAPAPAARVLPTAYLPEADRFAAPPVVCQAADSAPVCRPYWPAGTDCSTVVSCPDHSCHACRAANYIYDCTSRKCLLRPL
jgi:hypothetical protein